MFSKNIGLSHIWHNLQSSCDIQLEPATLIIHVCIDMEESMLQLWIIQDIAMFIWNTQIHQKLCLNYLIWYYIILLSINHLSVANLLCIAIWAGNSLPTSHFTTRVHHTPKVQRLITQLMTDAISLSVFLSVFTLWPLYVGNCFQQRLWKL